MWLSLQIGASFGGCPAHMSPTLLASVLAMIFGKSRTIQGRGLFEVYDTIAILWDHYLGRFGGPYSDSRVSQEAPVEPQKNSSTLN